jgi:adenosine deaminase
MDIDINNILEKYIKDLPKVELHVHFEAMIKLEDVKLMNMSAVLDQSSAPFVIFDFLVKLLCQDFPKNTGVLIESIFKDRLENNILYTQFQYSALKINEITTLDVKNQFDIIIDHIKNLKVRDPIYNKIYIDFILDIPRGDTFHKPYFSTGKYTDDIIKLNMNEKYKYFIRGLGIGGRVESNTIDNAYKEQFEKIRDAGLYIIPHAGEFCESDVTCKSIKSALNYSKRIGHGVRILECKDKIDNPSDIVLDISITSNLTFISNSDNCLAAPPPRKYTLDNHPIKELIHNGYTITLSTDDPGVLFKNGKNINLIDEYLLLSTLYKKFQDKIDIITNIVKNGINNIMISTKATRIDFLYDLQQQMLKNVEEKYTDFKNFFDSKLFILLKSPDLKNHIENSNLIYYYDRDSSSKIDILIKELENLKIYPQKEKNNRKNYCRRNDSPKSLDSDNFKIILSESNQYKIKTYKIIQNYIERASFKKYLHYKHKYIELKTKIFI